MFAILLILAVGFRSAWATDYNLLIEDPQVYSPCIDGPPGSIGINEAFNMDNMVFDQDEEGIHISGNSTAKWSFPRTDRISASFRIMHHNRGSWEPTVLSQVTRDFCAVFYHKDQYWYKYWFQNAANLEEIKKNCIATKDTVMVMNPFIMKLRLNNINGASFRGRYKAVFHIEAFDEKNKRRPTSLCFEFRGEIERTLDDDHECIINQIMEKQKKHENDKIKNSNKNVRAWRKNRICQTVKSLILKQES